MWGSSATLRKPPYVTLRLTFRFPLRGGLRSLTWLTFRWLTFSIIYSNCKRNDAQVMAAAKVYLIESNVAENFDDLLR